MDECMRPRHTDIVSDPHITVLPTANLQEQFLFVSVAVRQGRSIYYVKHFAFLLLVETLKDDVVFARFFDTYDVNYFIFESYFEW